MAAAVRHGGSARGSWRSAASAGSALAACPGPRPRLSHGTSRAPSGRRGEEGARAPPALGPAPNAAPAASPRCDLCQWPVTRLAACTRFNVLADFAAFRHITEAGRAGMNRGALYSTGRPIGSIPLVVLCDGTLTARLVPQRDRPGSKIADRPLLLTTQSMLRANLALCMQKCLLPRLKSAVFSGSPLGSPLDQALPLAALEAALCLRLPRIFRCIRVFVGLICCSFGIGPR